MLVRASDLARSARPEQNRQGCLFYRLVRNFRPCVLGILLLLGLATDEIGRRTRLPRVTLLLIFGFAIGHSGLDFLSINDGKWFPLIANMALVMIGFLLGEKFTLSSIRQYGKFVLWFSIAVVVLTALTIFGGLLLQAGVALAMALVAAKRYPHLGEIILPVVIASTVLFELIGPVFTRIALVRVGEVRSKQ